MTDIPTVKRCTRCGETKSVDGFSRNRSKRDGLASQCKECRRAYYEDHREERLAYNRAYNEAHREERLASYRSYNEAHREERIAYSRAYRDAHREECIAYDRAYNEAHREQQRAYDRAYYEEHREDRRAYDRDRYALLGNLTGVRWQEITAKHATRRGRWSEAEDAYLAASTDLTGDDALALKRTYQSVQHRIAHLRRSGVTLARDAHRS